ncbi:MAG: YgfZ/GcvT domain-containing protein [Clostridia bacterium]
MEHAKLERYGLISVSGEDARDFLHAQLTNDIQKLARDRAALAGWCTAKGRLLATLLVIPAKDGFLLQLSRDLVPAIAKRLSMFVLRSKVKIADVTAAWTQVGSWGEDRGPREELQVLQEGESIVVRMGERRFLLLSPSSSPLPSFSSPEEQWSAQEIQAGRPWITAATQDQFVPQMVNLEKIGGVDFQKGCYPGQEIVARAQYRGEVKRRMVRLPAPAGAALKPGQEFNGGVVVDAAGGELLAVMPV